MKNLLLLLIFTLFYAPNLLTAQTELACNELIAFSLSTDGTLDVSPSILLEGDVPDGTQFTIDSENYFDEISFDCDDTGRIAYIVEAPSGSQCWGVLDISDKLNPTVNVLDLLNVTQDIGAELVITPDMINTQSYDNCGIVEMIVEPSSFVVYGDEVRNVTLTIKDGTGNESSADVEIHVTANDFDCDINNVVAPLANITISNYAGDPAVMTPENLVANYGFVLGEVQPSFGDCDFESSYSDVVFIDNALFTINRTWVTIEWSTGDTIMYPQVLTNSFECNFDDVLVPDAIILNDVNVSSDDLSPDKLVELGYTMEETRPIVPDPCTSYLSVAYTDKIFNGAGDGFKIIRSWTVINWLTGSTLAHTQLIQNLESDLKGSIICDRLPRIAPVGDCASGHTLDDSVEWPAFLEISDYRISPDELEAFSNIQSLDSRPNFYKNEDDLVATYEDKFVELTAAHIKLRRVWTVVSLQYKYEWVYEQGIIVNYTQGVVTVNTPSNRPMKNVIFNNSVTTNEDGKVILVDEITSIDYNDNDVLNGVNLLDMVLLRAHTLKIIELDEYQFIAGDVNGDNELTSRDMVLIQRNILGNSADLKWKFIENSDSYPIAVRPQGSYIGVKQGDIDDSSSLLNEPSPSNNMIIQDQLLNKGGTYDIVVKLEHAMTTKGMELKFQIDQSILDVDDVVSGNYEKTIWNVTNDGLLTVLLLNDNINEIIDNEFLTLSVTALKNSLVHLGIAVDMPSFSASEDYKLEVISGEVTEQIQVGVLDPALEGLTIYPNPVSNFLNVDISKVNLSGDLSVTILNTNGQEILKENGNQRIDISSLSSGLYFYEVNYAGYRYIDKLSVVK